MNTFLSLLVFSTDTLSYGVVLYVLSASLFIGGMLAGVYVLTHHKIGVDRNFAVTILLFPVIAAVIILFVSNNIARAFSLAGVFTLIRFRTTFSDTRAILYVFATVAVGLMVGLGYPGYALVFALFFAFVMLAIHRVRFDEEDDSLARLKIIVPESLNYTHAFEDVFVKNLISSKLMKVKSTDFGTTFELQYVIRWKHGTNQKAFLDEIRARNGNLNISLTSEYAAKVTE